MVTVPTPDATGTPITIVGKATVDGKPLVSYLDVETLKSGGDARVDLCVPTITIAAPGDVLADGVSVGTVNATVNRCEDTQQPLGAQKVEFAIRHAGDANPTAASLSAPVADTDANGHATVKLQVGNTSESDVIEATTTIGTGVDAIDIHATAAVNVTSPPHVIYRWEQTTLGWSGHQHFEHSPAPQFNDPGNLQENSITGAPSTISRSGTLTPVGTNDAHLVEDVPANPVSYREVISDQRDPSRNGPLDVNEVIPVGARHRDVRLSQYATNEWTPAGGLLPPDLWTFARTSFNTSDTRVTVHHFADIGNATNYEYAADPNSSCTGTDFCFPEDTWNQVALNQRDQGSAIEYASDLTKDLNFVKLPDDSWSTYNYCGPVETLPMRGESLPPLDIVTGTAIIQTRFVAKVVTDNTDPSTLQFGNCTDPKPPIAAIVRTPIQANEGQLVHFVDASSDPNGDIVSWQWDFGDGGTSTDQFPDHKYVDNGTYTVTLTVTDATGNSDTTTVDETVVNVAPEIHTADVTVDTGVAAGMAFTAFDPGSRDAEALTLAISSSDPTLPQFQPVTVPAGAGVFNIGILPDGPHEFTATLTDKDGASATSTFTVNTGDLTTGTVEPQDDIEREAAPQCDYGVKLDINENDFVDQLVQYRKANGEPIVYASPTLTNAAETQAEYLRDNDLFSHTGKANSTPADRAKAAGYPGTLVGENLVRGTTSAVDALIAFKLSAAHDADQLNAEWNAVGVARVKTTHGWLWDVMFGDVLDCPTIPPDLNPGNNVPAPTPVSPPNPPVEVLAWTNAVTPPSNPSIPVTVFTVSTTNPDAGAAFTVTNRSSAPATFAPGDGRPPQPILDGATTNDAYPDTGPYNATIALGSWTATMAMTVGGVASPPLVTNDGATAGAQGANAPLAALVQTATHAPVIGRTVRFTIESKVVTGVTGQNGRADASMFLNLAAGPHTLQIDVPALTGGGVDATTNVIFTVAANTPPVVHLGGPYDALVNDPVLLDASTSFDPDGFPVTVVWDLNADGIFGDVTGPGVTVAGPDVATKICGGTCLTEHAYPVAVRVTDQGGATATVSTTVTLHRDFGLQVLPGAVTLNPGGSASLQVNVISTSGFAQPVALSVPDLPAGVTAQFVPQTVTPNGQSLLTLQANQNAGKLNQPITVRGTAGPLVHDATGTVDVEFGLVPQCFTALNVHVVDDETGLPVPSAFVAVNTFTDVNGNAQITNIGLPPGNPPINEPVSVSAGGYFRTDTTKLVGCGIVSSLDVRLVPIHKGVLAGHVFVGTPDPNDHRSSRSVVAMGTPVAGAQVLYPLATTATSAGDGSYSIDNVTMIGSNTPRRDLTTITRDGYWTENLLATVKPDQTTTLDVTLVPKCTGSADVRVLDQTTNKPIPDVAVSIFADNTFVSGTPRADGRVLIAKVPLGIRNSSVTQEADAQATFNGITVSGFTSIPLFDCGSVGVGDLFLQKPVERHATVQGTVTDDSGAPVPGVFVSTTANVATAQTDADGHYRIPTFRSRSAGARRCPHASRSCRRTRRASTGAPCWTRPSSTTRRSPSTRWCSASTRARSPGRSPTQSPDCRSRAPTSPVRRTSGRSRAAAASIPSTTST